MVSKGMYRVAACGSLVALSFVLAVQLGAQQVVASTPAERPEASRADDPRVAAIAARRVRVDLRDAPVRDALQNVAAQAGINLIINGALLTNLPRVTVHATNIP